MMVPSSRLPDHDHQPEQYHEDSLVATPPSSAAKDVRGLMTEPAGYWPAMARLSSG